MSERYIKRTQKGKGKILKEQKKEIKELISKNPNRNLLNKIIANTILDILREG